MRQTLFVTLFAAVLLHAPLAAAQDRAQVERRLQSVATLIDSSSAARQIDASRDPIAAERRSRARALQREAAAAFAANDLARASTLLDDATRQMLEAARMAAPEQVTADKKRADFDNRVESVKALLAAQQRIVKEKGAGPQSIEAGKQVETLVATATRQAQGGQIDQARATIDQAYLVAKVSIGSLRGGDTLVRSLHFESKKDEYDYELDRNETHRMLVTVLVEEKRAGNAALDRSVQGSLDSAAQMRGEAERLASRGQYDDAVRKLEDSTRELVRAIRGAGVYIPG